MLEQERESVCAFILSIYLLSVCQCCSVHKVWSKVASQFQPASQPAKKYRLVVVVTKQSKQQYPDNSSSSSRSAELAVVFLCALHTLPNGHAVDN